MSRKLTLIIFLLCLAWLIPTRAQAQTPVVHAVLFYSPTCPHCHEVMTNVLPPLKEQYGEQLQIMEINVTEQAGAELYQLAITAYSIPQDRLGVPALFVGDAHLVGSMEIPSWFPGIIEDGLQNGGLDWPPLPGLGPYVETFDATVTQQPLTMGDRFALDLVGNTIAVIVLTGLLITLFLAGYAYTNRVTLTPWPAWVMPVLIGLGMVVAGYLTFVETTNTEAVCGPVGDCNTVQQSEYARLFGVLPVGVLGLLGYVAIGIAYIVKMKADEKLAKKGALSMWWMALLGTAFSVYLTFLEPFVIGATCAWCLSSAIIMALVLWASTPMALQAVARRHRTRAGRA
ncbi:MAG: vitamin K epoxide reductase [Anaerolineales bacterium]|nr:vitamin K epoxide reductase [Anaerolineales bacterium]